ncbi:unnamed protein product, partial [Pylaiella littoralis]
ATGPIGGEETHPRHDAPFTVGKEATRHAGCGKLPTLGSTVEGRAERLFVNGPAAADDDDGDCFTYSDGEDDGSAPPLPPPLTPPPPPPSRSPLSLPSLVEAPAASTGDHAQDGVFGNSHGGSGGDVPSSREPQLSRSRYVHYSVGEDFEGVGDESGGDGTAGAVDKREIETPVVDENDGGHGRGIVRDTRAEGRTNRRHTGRVASWEEAKRLAATATTQALEDEGEGVNHIEESGREDRRRYQKESGRYTGAHFLADAYATPSSPTRDGASFLDLGQSRSGGLGKSLTSVASSFDVSPLKGESISALALVVGNDSFTSTGLCPGENGSGDCHLLAAAKASDSVGGSESYAAAVDRGQDLSKAFSTLCGEDQRPTHPREIPGDETASFSFYTDIDRRARESCGDQRSSRSPQPLPEMSAHGVDADSHSQRPEEEAREGKGGESGIAEWSTRELEEELCRIGEAVESRVRYLRSVMREAGSSAT